MKCQNCEISCDLLFIILTNRRSMGNFLVTGGAGFIGSNLVKKLISDSHSVTIFEKIEKNKAYRLESIFDKIEYETIDIKNLELIKQKIKNFDVVAHFAASADIAIGQTDTKADFENGIMTTFNVLEAMRINGINKIIFPSSSTIYGNFSKIPTPEDAGLLFPTSLYGAAKLSSEALISAFCHIFGMKSWIFRFGNVLGSDMTRGVIKDFIKKLKTDSTKLEILGNGKQLKDFIYVDDCIDAMLFALKNSDEVVNVFNLGTGQTTSVNNIAQWVIEEMNLEDVKLTYTGGESGWQGDAPIVHYDILKIKSLGWSPKLLSNEAVKFSIQNTLKSEKDES